VLYIQVREQQAEAEVLLARIGCLERELGESAEDVEELEAALLGALNRALIGP
jgi:hypothetical protein